MAQSGIMGHFSVALAEELFDNCFAIVTFFAITFFYPARNDTRVVVFQTVMEKLFESLMVSALF